MSFRLRLWSCVMPQASTSSRVAPVKVAQAQALHSLEPSDYVLEVDWFTLSEPPEGDLQTVGYAKVSRIDMRARKIFPV